MPAMDYLNKSAEITFDVTNNTSQSTAAVLMNRHGLVENLKCVAVVTEASAANYSTRTLLARMEYTTDNGTHWRSAGECSMQCGTVAAGGVPLQIHEFPVGVMDITVEQYSAANISWRGTVLLSSTLSTTDTFNVQFYLGATVGATAVTP